MGFQTWHNYGYGICIDDLKGELEVNRVLELVKLIPELYSDIIENGMDGNINDIYSYTGDLDYGYCGLASILKEVISKHDGIEFCDCSDFDDRDYLIYMPDYPWFMGKKDLELTEEKIEQVINKYLKIVTDESIVVGYESAENGG